MALLTSFGVRNFQSYYEEENLTVAPDLTLVAGRNNVGKSALLRAMRVFVEDQEGPREGFEVTYTWSLTADELLALTLQPTESAVEYRDWAESRDEHRLSASFGWDGGSEQADPSHLFMRKFALPDEGAVASGGTQAGPPRWTEGPWGGDAYLSLLRRAPDVLVRRVGFIGPRRIEHGLRNLTPAPVLSPDAGNLMDVVLRLQMNHPTTTYRSLIAFMTEAFPEIETVTVMSSEQDPARGELAVIYEAMPEKPIPLRVCGTGVEQMLSLAVGVLTAPEPRLFLIDEPQPYLHPHAERSLLALLSDHGQHQYVIATHSNYILGARPLSNARLLTTEGGHTRISEFPSREALLSELGITAADLWLAEAILWVEGASEVEVIEVVGAGVRGAEKLRVRRMPDAASRFSSSSPHQADATYRFCADVVEAISPLPVRMRFLFDADEKSEEHKARIEEASRGSARFLPVREVENLFLDSRILGPALRERSALVGADEPSDEVVTAALASALESLEDGRLYPGGPPGDAPDSAKVKGSEVLRRLYWDFTTSEYDKVTDGRRLAELAVENAPETLEPLRTVIEEVTARSSESVGP